MNGGKLMGKHIRELLLAIVLIILSVFIIFSVQPFYIKTSIGFLVLSFTIVLFSLIVKIKVVDFQINLVPYILLFLILFLNPDTLTLLVVIAGIIVQSRRNFPRLLLNISFSLFALSVAKLFYYLAPRDYLYLIFYAIGYLLGNLISVVAYNFVVEKIRVFNYLKVVFWIFITLVPTAVVVSTIYLSENVSFLNLLYVSLSYSAILLLVYFTLYYRILAESYYKEKEESHREIEHLNELQTILDSNEMNDTDMILNALLKNSCDVLGFEVALMSIIVPKTEKILRVAHYGLDDRFDEIRENQPDIKELYSLLQKRFETSGAYFIPSGSISLDNLKTYRLTEYIVLDESSAWQPDDIFILPINSKEKLIGYISFDKPKSGLRPTKREAEFGKFYAWQIGKILLKSEYSSLINENPDKKILYSNFMEKASRSIEETKNFIYAVIDIENLQKLNLEKGFFYCDKVLQTLEGILNRVVGKFGIYTRQSDEFYVLIWTRTKSEAFTLFEKILQDFETIYPDIRVKVALGKYPGDFETFEDMVNKVEILLNTMKKAKDRNIMSL